MGNLEYIRSEAEDYIFGFLAKILTKGERKDVNVPADVLRYLENNPDCEEDVKEQVWTMLKYELNFQSILERLQDYCRVNDSDSENDEEDGEGSADDSDEE